MAERSRRPRYHLTSVAVLGVVAVAMVIVVTLARSASEDGEQRLLDQRAEELALVIRGLGRNLQAGVAATTVAAQESGGDPAAFEEFVTGDDGDGSSTWVLLRRTSDGFRAVTRVGPDPLLGPMVTDGEARELEAAADGGMAILAHSADGTAIQAIGVAAGRPGVPGALLAYQELSLVEAAAGNGNVRSGFEDVGFELYLGDAVDPDRRILSLGMDQVGGPTTTHAFDFGGQDLVMVLGATTPLSGRLATALPTIIAVVGAAIGLVLMVLVEWTLRRRDQALALVEEVEAKNAELDRAMEEQRETERQRAELEEDLHQYRRLEAVGQLAGGIAHDFNNLLAAILSFAELAEHDLADHPSRDDVVEIRKAAERGASLTRQLLAFSRRDTRQADEVDLNAVVEDVRRLLSRTLPADVELRLDLADDLPPVLADAGELEQVLMNLLVNAGDAVDVGGTITVGTGTEHLDEADLVAHPGMEAGPAVHLVVRDDGCGMDAEAMDRAFDPFFTTKDRGRGTGLGLATVYGIVRRAHGHVQVSSRPGEGTTFSILLPAAAGHAGPDGDPVADGERVAAGDTPTRVLVAEDEEPVRRAARRHLEAAGYEVLEAADATAALEVADGTRIDVLLTDLVMPGTLTGLDLAERLTATRPGLAVVYMTGYSGEVAGRTGLELDGPVLRKPFTSRSLVRAIEDVHRVARQLREAVG